MIALRFGLAITGTPSIAEVAVTPAIKGFLKVRCELTIHPRHTSHMAGMDELTQTQRRVFDFIRQKLIGGFLAPTAREVSAQFGWSSKRAAECHIEALIRKGFLVADPGKARSIRLKDVSRAFCSAVVEIPVFGSIPAGFGRDREQEADECIPVTIE